MCRLNLSAFVGAGPHQSLPKQCPNWADLKAAYRSLGNPRIKTQAIQQPHHRHVRRLCERQSVVLCVQDTSDLDFTSRTGIRNLGKTGNGSGRGILQHTCLAVLPDRGAVLGVLHQDWHARVQRKSGETRKQCQARWRESQVWADTIEQVGPGLGAAGSSTWETGTAMCGRPSRPPTQRGWDSSCGPSTIGGLKTAMTQTGTRWPFCGRRCGPGRWRHGGHAQSPGRDRPGVMGRSGRRDRKGRSDGIDAQPLLANAGPTRRTYRPQSRWTPRLENALAWRLRCATPRRRLRMPSRPLRFWVKVRDKFRGTPPQHHYIRGSAGRSWSSPSRSLSRSTKSRSSSSNHSGIDAAEHPRRDARASTISRFKSGSRISRIRIIRRDCSRSKATRGATGRAAPDSGALSVASRDPGRRGKCLNQPAISSETFLHNARCSANVICPHRAFPM